MPEHGIQQVLGVGDVLDGADSVFHKNPVEQVLIDRMVFYEAPTAHATPEIRGEVIQGDDLLTALRQHPGHVRTGIADDGDATIHGWAL